MTTKSEDREDVVEMDAMDVVEWEHGQHTPQAPASMAKLVEQTKEAGRTPSPTIPTPQPLMQQLLKNPTKHTTQRVPKQAPTTPKPQQNLEKATAAPVRPTPPPGGYEELDDSWDEQPKSTTPATPGTTMGAPAYTAPAISRTATPNTFRRTGTSTAARPPTTLGVTRTQPMPTVGQPLAAGTERGAQQATPPLANANRMPSGPVPSIAKPSGATARSEAKTPAVGVPVAPAKVPWTPVARSDDDWDGLAPSRTDHEPLAAKPAPTDDDASREVNVIVDLAADPKVVDDDLEIPQAAPADDLEIPKLAEPPKRPTPYPSTNLAAFGAPPPARTPVAGVPIAASTPAPASAPVVPARTFEPVPTSATPGVAFRLDAPPTAATARPSPQSVAPPFATTPPTVRESSPAPAATTTSAPSAKTVAAAPAYQPPVPVVDDDFEGPSAKTVALAPEANAFEGASMKTPGSMPAFTPPRPVVDPSPQSQPLPRPSSTPEMGWERGAQPDVAPAPPKRNTRRLAIFGGAAALLVVILIVVMSGGSKKADGGTTTAEVTPAVKAPDEPKRDEAPPVAAAAVTTVPTTPAESTPSPVTDPVPTADPGKAPVANRPAYRPRAKPAKPLVLDYDKPKADATPPSDTPDQALAKARAAYASGNQHLFAGEADAAISAYKQALAVYPGYVAGYRGLGLAYAQQGDPAAALKAFKTYVGLVPNAKDIALIKKRIARLAP